MTQDERTSAGGVEVEGRGRLLDELAARATVSPVDRDVGGWYAKAAPDLPFRRCNAVLPPPGAASDETGALGTLEAIEHWYAGFGQRVIVVISSADPGAVRLDELLARRGYAPEAPVHVMARPIARGGEVEAPGCSSPATGAPVVDVAVTEGIDEVWAARYAAAHGGDRAARHRTESYGRMLDVLGSSAIGGSAAIGGAPAGVGFGVLDTGWVGVFGMGTSPDHRRRGVATAIVRALLERAADRGAAGAYLQVETDNRAAIDLYTGLGFTRSHGYHYRVSAPVPG